MKKFLRHIIFIPCSLLYVSIAPAQDTSLVHLLVQRIASQQVKEDEFFMRGIFPSYISNDATYSAHKKDNNIFYNGLITLTLKNIYQALSDTDKKICDTIFESQKRLFAYFKNKTGRNTYNFWRTDSLFVFPYTGWVRLIKKHPSLPDDMDDTALSLLALAADDSTASAVHALMQQYINSDDNSVRILLKQYSSIPAYSTWFGKKFPVVFDACVMSNVLGFVQHYNLQWSKADSASLQFIVSVLNNEDHITHASEVAPYYGRASIILYHISRLMAVKPIPELESIKPKLVADAVNEFAITDNILEKIILCSAISKWGYMRPQLQIPSFADLENKIEKNDMPFFIGNIPSYMKDLPKKILSKNKLGYFYHYCPAYNDALLLEYLVLQKN